MKPAAEMTQCEVDAYRSKLRGGQPWPAHWTIDQKREQIAYEQRTGQTEGTRDHVMWGKWFQ